ncbi:glycosyltransferase family 4 protein [Kiloniella sp.]|uniref:glycosyltransferase family 4 protein n=1 Tax=Kiloniella sp. TaxID=1938587 RepID=UPI003B02E8A5
MARLVIQALKTQGHTIELASQLRSRDAVGNPERQRRLKNIGEKIARRYLRRIKLRPKSEQPELWLTYHLYYKAPDWIGPIVCRELDIPYVAIEASVANKRAGGPWDLSHRAVVDALDQAECVISLNPHDSHCLPPNLRNWLLPPFIVADEIISARDNWSQHRRELVDKYNLDPNKQWLLCIAMMREGDKLASYRVLANALRGLPDLQWQLLIVGDGKARDEVEAAYRWASPNKVFFTGELSSQQLAHTIPACDIYTWPAINEAYGLAFLEAQAGGLPIIAGNTGGVPAVVTDGETGILTSPGDSVAFAAALRTLLSAPVRRRAMGQAAAEKVKAVHSLENAGYRLDQILAASRKDYIKPGLPLLDYGKNNSTS